MKKLTLTLVAILTAATLSAQPHTARPGHGFPTPPPPTPSIVVEAQHGETFHVYVGGDLIDATPRNRIVVDKLGNQPQEVIVVLNHPARKAASIQVVPSVLGTPVAVSYDHRTRQMYLNTQHHGTAHTPHHGPATPPAPPTPPQPNMHPAPPQPTPPGVAIEEPAVASDAWVHEMIGIIKSQSFDSEKLSTAKGLLNNPMLLTSAQIANIAGTLDFANSQVDFLKAAYLRCIDPENYERALAVLKFSNDRQKVRTYISTLR